jgi:hypothetical protein
MNGQKLFFMKKPSKNDRWKKSHDKGISKYLIINITFHGKVFRNWRPMPACSCPFCERSCNVGHNRQQFSLQKNIKY